ncbi:MAG: TRAP transporter small permease [Deltaproteobacteria bacterium]|nr:TRAP transporter small permease [Deltaproteobacteria bacterium]
MMHRWERVDALVDRVEQTVISILLSVMILIAVLQIVLRNIFATGLTGGDPLVRNLVLWVGFIGATLATKEGKHISIDVISHWVPSRGRIVIEGIIHVSSFIICGLLTFAAVKFIRNEALMGSVTFLGIRAWVPELILPITFGLMTLRFGFRFLKTFL